LAGFFKPCGLFGQFALRHGQLSFVRNVDRNRNKKAVAPTLQVMSYLADC
jgi:hypothetical protein